jgi:hypothetical protein
MSRVYAVAADPFVADTLLRGVPEEEDEEEDEEEKRDDDEDEEVDEGQGGGYSVSDSFWSAYPNTSRG